MYLDSEGTQTGFSVTDSENPACVPSCKLLPLELLKIFYNRQMLVYCRVS